MVKLSDATIAAAAAAAEKERIYLRRMQQMAAAGNMGILNPFVFNQFGSYGTFAAAQVLNIFYARALEEKISFFTAVQKTLYHHNKCSMYVDSPTAYINLLCS